jgi:hypothetical protein
MSWMCYFGERVRGGKRLTPIMITVRLMETFRTNGNASLMLLLTLKDCRFSHFAQSDAPEKLWQAQRKLDCTLDRII